MRILSVTRRLFLTVFALAVTGFSSQSLAGAPFYGLGQSKDGDSLMVGQREVRLFGIDAPEWDQSCNRAGKPWACGQQAAAQLSKLVTGKQVRCISVGTDQHERTLGRCTVGTVDVNRQMVATGYAVAYRHYSMDYVSAEQSAKSNKRGLWAGTFEMPSDVRHAAEEQGRKPVRNRKRAAPIAQVASAGSGCMIKGNQGSNGWIYHLPGMPFYARTKAEQMFCSESEARAAGYRRAKVR